MTIFLALLSNNDKKNVVVFAHKKTIALTIDDLPFVGEYRNFHLNMMIETMLKQDGLIDSGLRTRTSTGEEK